MVEASQAAKIAARRSLPVDLRSDTVTQPGPAMRAAMAAAEVGDDGFRDDPTVLALERRVASLLQKEAALFVPSGTMSNQIALRLHAQPGDAVIAHRNCHIFEAEAGGAAALAGVTMLLLTSDDGGLDLEEVRANLHLEEDGRSPPTTLICFENTHNARGGMVVPPENIERVAALARHHGLRLHLDGARLLNAAAACRRSAGELAASFHTVTFCLSKGLGAPAGSLLVGDREQMERARRLRRMMGGMMRQVGILAAAGLYALDHNVARLAEDHLRAAQLAAALSEIPGVRLSTPQTNIVRFALAPTHPVARDIERGGVGLVSRLERAGVLVTGRQGVYRAVLHLGVDDDDLDRAVAGFVQVLAR